MNVGRCRQRRLPCFPPRLVALGLLLAFALAPTSAQAGCGDHVRTPGRDSADAKEAERPSPLPAGPCHGPHCSRHENVPLAPTAPASPVRLSVEKVGCLTVAPRAADLGRSLDG